MRKRISTLVLPILVVLLLPLGAAMAGLIHTPHEDPSTAESNADIGLPVLLRYADILSALAGQRYQDVRTMIEQMELDKSNISDDIRFVMQRYNDLVSQLSDKLDKLDALLNEIEPLLNQGRLAEAHPKLADARGLVEEARSLLDDLDEATAELVRVLQRFVNIAEVDALDEAKARLQEAMQRLEEFEDIYEALLRKLEIAVEEVHSRNLTLEVDKSRVHMGDIVTASGTLTFFATGETQPLPDREITILLDGKVVATTTTSEDGSYQGKVSIPRLPLSTMTLQASYTPEGPGAFDYLPSFSPPVELQMVFYTTDLTLHVDNASPWVGESMTASGTLISPEEGGVGLPGRVIEILLDGMVVNRVTTGTGGSYQGTVMVPYEYITPRKIQARYAYTGDEYIPCWSSVVGIEVHFYSLTLTLVLDNTKPWVGDTITASGALTWPEGGGIDLPVRPIDILLDGAAVGSVTTGIDGLYQGTVTMPREYMTPRTLQARYDPQKEDEAKYLPASSDRVDVNVLFYRTQLEIQTPDKVYPGLPLKVGGQIAYDQGAPLVDRQVSIFWDDELLREFNCQDAFEVEVVPYPQTVAVTPSRLEGEHTLRVVAESKGRYKGTLADSSLVIVKSLPEIKLQTMSFVAPLRKVQLKGRLCSDLPLQESLVEVELRGISQIVSTSADGEFQVVFNLPLDSIVMGAQEVTIRVQPFEIWHLSFETTTKVFVVDGVNLGLISVAFVSVGVVLYTRRRSRTTGSRETHVLGTPSTPLERAASGLIDLEELKGDMARISKAYAEAATVVAEATKVSMKPHMTLREFLREVLPGLDGAAEAFAELTRLSEAALYSPHIPGEDEAVRAEDMARRIGEALGK